MNESEFNGIEFNGFTEPEGPPPLPSLPGDAVLDIRRIKRHRTHMKGGRS